MDNKNSGASVIKQLLAKNDLTIKDLASKLGYSSAQVLSNKLYRDTLSLNEYIKLANILGCEVKTISKDGTSSYLNEYIEKK